MSHPSFSDARAAIVAACFQGKPAATDPGVDEFRSTRDFADWCMSGSAGDETTAALKALGEPDYHGDMRRSVRDAIEDAADAYGLGWVNDGLAPAEHQRPMNGMGGFAD